MQESDDLSRRPVLLTLAMDDISFAHFDALRRNHFPPERNFLAAHITLFHNLPQAQIVRLETDLKDFAAGTTAFSMTIDDLWMLGSGVAYTIKSEKAKGLRDGMAKAWDEFLIPQDRQFKPHITVQNKVDAAAAKALYVDLTADFSPLEIQAVGLDLWRYDHGPWAHLRRFAFQNASGE